MTKTIKSAHCHPDYTTGDNNIIENDICVLRLDSPVDAAEAETFPRNHLFHRHLCLASKSSVPESQCTVAGWGVIEEKSVDRVMNILIVINIPMLIKY